MGLSDARFPALLAAYLRVCGCSARARSGTGNIACFRCASAQSHRARYSNCGTIRHTLSQSAEMPHDSPSGPTVATIKRLFALSGNRCAFPKCTDALIDGKKVVGKICHIKAQSERGPRYDPAQSAEERHGYDNLILMCGRHADVIDADEEAYTVEYLHRLKARHEVAASSLSEQEAEHGAQLLFVTQQISSTNQSGGITAHTVHVHNYGVSTRDQDQVNAKANIAPKNGLARFRAPGEPLGMFWNMIPLAPDYGYDIFLSDGPAVWLQVVPHSPLSRDWPHEELLRCARMPNVPLQPLGEWVGLQYLRADDGIGAYTIVNPLESENETASVAFAFCSGGLWCTDTSILQISRQKSFDFLSVARTLPKRLRGSSEFMKCLGVDPPYRWIAGIEGVKGWVLKTPSPQHHISTSPGEMCLADVISADGVFDPQQPAATSLIPFFRQLYKKCGLNIPSHIEQLLREHRS